MNTVKLADTYRLMFGTTSGAGAAINADSTPTVTVRDQGTAMAYAPTVTNKATGLYEVALLLTSGNGFTTGHEYTVEVAATVGGVTGRDGLASFKILSYNAEDIISRLPAALVSGRIDASVGAMAANVVTAAAIATDAIDADALKADAVTEIVTAVWAAVLEGTSTASDLIRGTISALVGTVSNFTTATKVFKSLNGAKTRWTVTTDSTGRTATTVGDLT